MFHNQHESRGVHLSDYIESESDSGMKRFSLQDGQMSNCMLSARFLWYKAIIIKPFLFFPEKSVGYFIAEKCINNLAVWKIRVNTHTHTQLSRVNI